MNARTAKMLTAIICIVMVATVFSATLQTKPTNVSVSSKMSTGFFSLVAPPESYRASAAPLGPANEVHVAVNPNDDKHLLVVAKDYSLGGYDNCSSPGEFHVGSASYVTMDGGMSWTRTRVPGPYPSQGSATSPLPYPCGSDPVAMFGPDGTAYYLMLNFEYMWGGRHSAIVVARSLDGGLTWPEDELRIVVYSDGADKEWGTVDDEGRLHIAWLDTETKRTMYRRSTLDFEFTDPVIDIAGAGVGNPGVQVATGPDDMVYVFWRDGDRIKFRKSDDDGQFFFPAKTASYTYPYSSGTEPRLPFFPSMTVDDNTGSIHAGRIYVAWPDEFGDALSNILLRYSDDEGENWSDFIQVDTNDDPALRSVLPSVSVAPNGRVDVAWMQEVPDTGTNFFHAFAARSKDGGTTWKQFSMASDEPVDADYSFHQRGKKFIGDYIGSASSRCAIWIGHPATYDDGGVLRTDATLTKVPICSRFERFAYLVSDIIEDIPPFIRPVGNLEKAIAKLQKSDLEGASKNLMSFVDKVEVLMKKSVVPYAKGQSWIESAEEVNEVMTAELRIEVDGALVDAGVFAGKKKVEKEIAKAEREIVKAERYKDHTDKDGTPDPIYDKAIGHYINAWVHAQRAIKHAMK